ncbi:MAG: thiamine pyrophosphate-dependent enzyme, partial [Pseudomonadota bacterium]
ICNNNFTYGMTGGQVTPTTPQSAISSTTPFGNHEYPFNLPFLADAAGATYIARWTSMHSRNLIQSIEEALSRKGFSFIEIVSPCTTLYLRRNRLGDGVDALQYYQENAVLKRGADTRELAIDFQDKIIIGKFVEKDKPTYIEALDRQCVKVVGDDYELYGKTMPEREAEEKAEKERVAARRAAVLAKEEKARGKAGEARISAKIPVKAGAKKAAAKTTKKAAAATTKKVAAKTVTAKKPAAKSTTAKKAVVKTAKKVAAPKTKAAVKKVAAKPAAKKVAAKPAAKKTRK